jgi:hypothetical protein
MAGKAFPVPADAATQDLPHARALNNCQHRPLSESGHPDRPVLAKLTYDEITFNGEPTFNGPPRPISNWPSPVTSSWPIFSRTAVKHKPMNSESLVSSILWTTAASRAQATN